VIGADARLAFLVSGEGTTMLETLPTIEEIGKAVRWVTSARSTGWDFGAKPMHLVVMMVAKPSPALVGSSTPSSDRMGFPVGDTFRGMMTLVRRLKPENRREPTEIAREAVEKYRQTSAAKRR
jgi:hypothetical protein